MRPPKRTVLLGPEGDQVRIELVGELNACMDYEEVADGQSLEELALELSPTAKRRGDELDVKTKRMKSRMVANLLFAFSASWRADSGWDARHTRESDPVRDPRSRANYLDLAKLVSAADKRRIQSILLALLMETVFPPGATAIATEPAAR